MKILCPVDSPAEAARLVELGAAEVYGGFLPRRWEERFTLAAPANRRSFPEAQIRDEGALREVVEEAHGAGGKFFLTVNSPFYTAEQSGLLLRIIDRAVCLGVDALIAADAGLMAAARERWPQIPVHASTLAEVGSSPAVRFYRRLGVRRITLPRHLSLRQIGEIVRSSPGTEFDTFVLYGQCVNDEGHCTFSHDEPSRVWPCVQEYRVSGGRPGRGRDREAPALCGQMLWAGLPRGEACGLCALWDLKRLGVQGLKIVGRGTSRERKEWAVAALVSLLPLAGDGAGREEFRRRARSLYRERFPRGCRPTLCYFPELLEGDGD